MASDVEICNRALSRVGTRSTISALSEQSAEAIQCSLFYSATVREMLRDYKPKFARRQVFLADIGNPPLPWAYRYAEPSDLVVSMEVRPNMAPIMPGVKIDLPVIPFLSTGDDDTGGNPIRVILCNQPQAVLVYITNRVATAPNVWDDDFMAALESALASKLAIPLTGDKTIAANQFQIAKDAIAKAGASDGNENPVINNQVPDWIRAHGYVSDNAVFPGNSEWGR